MTTANRIKIADLTPQKQTIFPRPKAVNWVVTLARQIDAEWWKYLLVLSDGFLILLAFGGAYYVRYQLQWFRAVADPSFQLTLWDYSLFAVALMVLVLLSFRFSAVYPYRPGRNLVEEIYAIGTATTWGVVVLIVVSLYFQQVLYSRLIFLYAALLITSVLGISRLFINIGRAYLRRYGIGVERVLLVGAGEVGRIIMRTVVARPDLGYQLVGFLDDNQVTGSTDIGPFKALGPIENLEHLLERRLFDSVIICLPWQSHRLVQRLLRLCQSTGVHAQVVPDFFQITKDQLHVEVLNGVPLISTRAISIRGGNLVLKRIADIGLAIFFGLLGLPLMAMIALAIALDSPGPLIYSQTRVGKNGRHFRCYKFRSMVQGADDLRHLLNEQNEASGPLFKVREDPRCTRVGRLMRRFSLDELPQLYNVLRGDMSLVGPRPNLPQEVEQYQEWHKKRLSANPGLTGLWQVSGRSDLTFDEMVLLDIYYVENWSLALDLSILLRSLPAVLRGRGAY
jgi:exopolysaccharide biosynthesis polyprenyl glycosylphosphotransferase